MKITKEMSYIMNHKGEEPVIVSADAGSGKTTTLLKKAVDLANMGRKILVLSFSNESVEDINKKIEEGYKDKIVAMTFHSFLLSAHNLSLKEDEKVSFIPPVESAMLQKKLMSQALEESEDNFLVSSVLTNFKSTVENLCWLYEEISSKSSISPSEYIEKNLNMTPIQIQESFSKYIGKEKLDNYLRKEEIALDGEVNFFLRAVLKILRRFSDLYKNELSSRNLITYDMVEFIKNPSILLNAIIKNGYTSLLVDEYQDVNHRQDHIVEYIESLDCIKNSYKFGDSKQSIYRFRGCDNKFFKKRLKKEKHFTLTRNFRTNNNILQKINLTMKDRYNLNINTSSEIEGEYTFNTLEAVKLSSGRERYAVEYNKSGNFITFRTVAERKKYLKKVLYDKIKEFESNSESIAILVSKRSNLNDFEDVLGEFSLKKRSANLTESNEFKTIYFVLVAMLGKVNALIKRGLNDAGIENIEALLTPDEYLKTKTDINIFKKFLAHVLKKTTGYEDWIIEDILSVIVDNQSFYIKNSTKNYEVRKYLEDTLSFVERIFNSDISVPSNIKDRGKIRVLTKHSSKGLEFDSVINISVSNTRTLNDTIVFSELGLLSDFYTFDQNGFLTSKESINKKIGCLLEEPSENEQEMNLEYVSMTRAKKNYFEMRL